MILLEPVFVNPEEFLFINQIISNQSFQITD